jgi:organic hydroperoxide reductase OsmC/OhrA
MFFDLRVAVIGVCIAVVLASCIAIPETQVITDTDMALATPELFIASCEACDQATLAVVLTQQKISSDNQAAATAEILRANAQATVNSANATLNVAQTQSQNNANVIAAQIAGTAEIVRANAQATIVSAGSTQSAALTQDAIGQTQMADLATSNALVILNQQNSDNIAAGTQTAISDNIATQTQAAVATSQSRDEQNQEPITFLTRWFLPMFFLLIACLVILGFWRWMKIQQDNQRILENPVEKLPVPVTVILPHAHHNQLPYPENDVIDERYEVTSPDDYDQVPEWLDEVKRNLLNNDKKDEDNDTNN